MEKTLKLTPYKLGRIEKAIDDLEWIITMFEGAKQHIQGDLQPAFEMLADTGKLPWPSAWTKAEYDQEQAAYRLATWYHGAWDKERIKQARKAVKTLKTYLK